MNVHCKRYLGSLGCLGQISAQSNEKKATGEAQNLHANNHKIQLRGQNFKQFKTYKVFGVQL